MVGSTRMFKSILYIFRSFHLLISDTYSADEKIVLYSGSMHDGRHLQFRRSLYRTAEIELSTAFNG